MLLTDVHIYIDTNLDIDAGMWRVCVSEVGDFEASGLEVGLQTLDPPGPTVQHTGAAKGQILGTC